MSSQAISERQTKYCAAIEKALKDFGHATNLELLHELRHEFPALSATTIHRVTARLASRGKIAVAPPAKDGSIRYDSNLKPHDHFLCGSCGKLLDTDIKQRVVPVLEAAIEGCRVSGRLTISGVCKDCSKGEKNENNSV